MYGNRDSDRLAQLALLDAIVFFVIATSISSMMFYYAGVRDSERSTCSLDGQSDPNSVLNVFLHASLGSEVVLALSGTTRVSAGSEVAECVQIELDALADGADVKSYEPLNQRFMLILNATCGAVLHPYLVALWRHDGGQETILAIPGQPPPSSTRYAGFTQLPAIDGSSYVLTLVLVPAASPEILHVSTGDFDFGLRVGQTPADLKP